MQSRFATNSAAVGLLISLIYSLVTLLGPFSHFFPGLSNTLAIERAGKEPTTFWLFKSQYSTALLQMK